MNAINHKEFHAMAESISMANGIALPTVLDVVGKGFSLYARSHGNPVSPGKGTFVTYWTDTGPRTVRQWEIVANDGALDDPDTQWRLMDAEDENFGTPVPGAIVEQEWPLEVSRQFKTWMQGYLQRELLKLQGY